ncbi:MAG: endoribonuclease MazF [Methylobacter tundripaludum]|jgi:mRNA interferase MazF|uniref:endoribonuclease MazF n=1 Tax=Methylobacter sp. TaxID=2051955 RepID=UPI002489A7B1|nr:endoribonuclease MazF [Methylobacter sp.]MDD4906555.1 endoribonuclease MazF [Methylobacter tundripaludum]MDI1276684.1 endoribonuclease MazF [Methylobacter sp.]MDI1357353.1 endoribonuclease MazF [Methylobacter sp.]
MAAKYAPERGDIVWLTFDPQAGHEQAGRRPALVLSPKAYNAKTSLALICPITSQTKGYPFEVALPNGHVNGVILADQVRNLDWTARRAEKISSVSDEVLSEVLAKLSALM